MKSYLILTGSIIVVVAALAVSLWLAAAFIIYGGDFPGMKRTFVTAEYDRMEFGGEGANVLTFATGMIPTEDKGVAPIYLKLPNSNIVYLPDLVESDLVELITDAKRETFVDGRLRVRCEIENTAHATFINGRLILFSVSSKSRLQFGLQKQGEFIGLPTSTEEVTRLFGPPNRYRYSHPKPI